MSAAGNNRRTSDRDDWETPPELFKVLDREFQFAIDAAASLANALCDHYFDEVDDGLSLSWSEYASSLVGSTSVFCNPPYSDVGSWIAKCAEEGVENTVVAVVPNATDNITTFHELIIPTATEVRLLKGRVQFLIDGERPRDGQGRLTSNTTGTMVIVWRAHAPQRGHPHIYAWEWKK